MSGSEGKKLQKSPCSIKNMPVPELVKCSKCGEEIEFWTDDEEAACSACGHKIVKQAGV